MGFNREQYDFTVKGPWTEVCGETTTEWKWKQEGGVLYIAFKGSTAEQGSKDWIQNFTVPLWPARAFKNMRVAWFSHLGFHRKWQSVQHGVFDLIRRLDPAYIWVGGFSQGGAVANRAYEDIGQTFPRYVPGVNLSGCTFGAPAAVWFWNLRKIRDRWAGMEQYQDRADIVPKLTTLFGYRHTGKAIKLGERRWVWPWLLADVHCHYERYAGE